LNSAKRQKPVLIKKMIGREEEEIKDAHSQGAGD